ncbi:MAG TPA: hypothetical protein VE990_16165 [Acidimicrobiales bacterium]|nr:hypothetical protein [Acidimicrobiales bacterium]
MSPPPGIVTGPGGVDFDLRQGPFADDPYPILDWLREHRPVCWHRHLEAWLVTRYDDVRAVVGDETRFLPALPPEPQAQRRHFILMNGQEHRQFRRLLAPSFTKAALAQAVEPALPALVRDILDRLPAEDGEIDLVSAVADRVPPAVIRHLTRMDDFDEDRFMADADAFLEYAADPSDPELAASGPDAHRRVVAWLSHVLATHRAERRGGIVTDLLEARVEGRPLAEPELLAFC